MKKLVSLFLTLALALSLASVAFAYSYVAEVNGKAFSSIEAAMLVAKKGETVSLLKDTGDPVEIDSVTDVTLDLNGHVINNFLTVNDSSITILDSVKPGRGAVIGYGEDTALTVTGSTLVIQSGQFISEEGNALEARNSTITILNGSFSGEFAVEETVMIIYSGLFTTYSILPYIHEKCSVALNTDEDTAEFYPYEVKTPGGSQESDIEELPIIGSLDTLLSGDFRCPACDRFEQIYNGENGNIIATFSPVYYIFQVIHTMIHTIYRVTSLFG